jgi:hypothetical protein
MKGRPMLAFQLDLEMGRPIRVAHRVPRELKDIPSRALPLACGDRPLNADAHWANERTNRYLLFGPSTGPPRPSKKETAQGAGKTQKEEKEEEVEQQLVGQRITAPPATETSIVRYRPAVPDTMNSSSEKGPFSPVLKARRWIVVEPMATTEEDAAATADAATTDAFWPFSKSSLVKSYPAKRSFSLALRRFCEVGFVSTSKSIGTNLFGDGYSRDGGDASLLTLELVVTECTAFIVK